jgi:hypothetical protein
MKTLLFWRILRMEFWEVLYPVRVRDHIRTVFSSGQINSQKSLKKTNRSQKHAGKQLGALGFAHEFGLMSSTSAY